MKIWNSKVTIGPVLFLIPMACMHLGDGHHSGDQHFFFHQPSVQSSIHDKVVPEMQCLSSKNGGFTLFTYGHNLNIVYIVEEFLVIRR